MATGTIRYWAAARAAAGVHEEPYDARTLAEALQAARAAHGDKLGQVLDRCSYVVDSAPVGGRSHDAVALTDGGSVEVLPPFAGGAGPTTGPPARPATGPAAGSTTGPVTEPAAETARSPVPGPGSRRAATGVGLAAGAVAAALAGLAVLHIGLLAAGVFVVQAVLALAWLAALEAPGGGGAFVIAVVAAGVMDGLVATGDGPDIGRAAGVAGVATLVALLYQLARRPRLGVTLSFVGTVSALVFGLAASAYVALAAESGGDFADVCALLGAGIALAVARLLDLLLPRPAAVAGSRRGVAGLVVGVAAAAAVGWGCGAGRVGLGSGSGLRLAIVAAVIALVADLAVDAVLSAAPPREERARSALPPLGILLPVVLAGPAAYVAGRILLG